MIHGLLPLNKPSGITSHQAVESVRRVFSGHKAGHFGTLDPLAEGLLLVGIGRGTRFFQFYQGRHKVYSGVVRFGFATDTYDREGIRQGEIKPVDLRKIDLEGLLAPFRGVITQMPPVFSAKKLNGRPLYSYARKKIPVAVKPVKVTVHSLEGRVLAPDLLMITAETGPGTYIRSLAHDMGEKLGCGAHLENLVRVSIGEFTIENAVTTDALDAKEKGNPDGIAVIPVEELLPEFPRIIVTPQGRSGVLNGNPIEPRHIQRLFSALPSPWYRIFDERGRLLSLATPSEKRGEFSPQMVFADES